MKHNKKVALLDCDGPLYNFIEFALAHISSTTGQTFDPEEYKKDDFRSWPLYTKEHEEYFRGPGISQKLELRKGAPQFVEDLKSRGFDVIYCTSPYWASPTWAYDRAEAIKRDFGDGPEKVIFARTRQKKHVQGSFILDDHSENCTTWSEFNYGTPSILDNHPWNEEFRNNRESHTSFQWGARKIQHLTGIKDRYSINCANSYDDVLFILKEIGLAQK